MTKARKVLHLLREQRESAQARRIYQKYQAHTMIPKPTYTQNLELARHVRDVPGSVVECGVWKGGMIAGIAEVLGDTREYVLFDSFQGLPPANGIDGEAALAWQADKDGAKFHDNCTASAADAEAA